MSTTVSLKDGKRADFELPYENYQAHKDVVDAWFYEGKEVEAFDHRGNGPWRVMLEPKFHHDFQYRIAERKPKNGEVYNLYGGICIVSCNGTLVAMSDGSERPMHKDAYFTGFDDMEAYYLDKLRPVIAREVINEVEKLEPNGATASDFMGILLSIECAEEAYRRMLDGEVFHNGDNHFEYNSDSLAFVTWFENDMEVSDKSAIEPYDGIAELCNWEVEVEFKWYDDIPEGGVICWVSDTNPRISAYSSVDIITSMDGDWFVTTDETVSYAYATPVKPSECMEG